jgi:hypothetical protein
MKENLKAKLWVNKTQIGMNPFVEEFLARTTVGAVAALKGTEDLKTLWLHQRPDDIEITVNGEPVNLTPFPNEIIRNTLTALVCSLKGIDRIDSLEITVEKQ